MRYISIIWVCLLIISCKNNTVKDFTEMEDTFMKVLSSEKSGVTFKNEVKESFERNTMIFDYFYNGGGVSIGDINNDGLADLFFTGNDVENKLYLNKGNLQFEDITTSALGIQLNKWSTGSNFVDINNDGLLDIYVCNAGPSNDPTILSNDLYINNGDLTFTNKAKEYGLADDSRTIQAGFFDYDNDGDIDVWLNTHTNFDANIKVWEQNMLNAPVEISKKFRNRLFRNDDGKFIDVGIESGVTLPGFNLGLSIFDVNDDGWLDVFVANDYYIPDFCYINDGNGKFDNRSSNIFSQTSFYSMGSDAADTNNDGILDLVVVDMTPKDHIRNKVLMESMNPERFKYISSKFGHNEQYMFNTLQMGVGGGFFSEVGKYSDIALTDWSWAALLADFNNDGNKDLFVANGFYKDTKNNDFKLYTQKYKDSTGITEFNEKVFNDLSKKLEQNPVKNYFFKNDANGKFIDVSDNWSDHSPSFSNGAAYGDLDNDGDLDLVINNLGSEASILINEAKKTNYLRVKLHENNKFNSTLYSQIYVYQNGNVQRVDNSTTRGYQSSMEPVVHFGLGNNPKIDSIKIIWPDFTQSTLNNISANQVISIDKATTQRNPRRFNNSTSEFINITTKIEGFGILHQEIEFNDFKDEVLLPQKYSAMGPALAVGDVDNDGFQDFFLGGSKSFPARLYTQGGNKFNLVDNPSFVKDAIFEDLGALFFDADNDGDLDLYVASGGGGDVKENLSACQDRLYLNEKGVLKAAIARLPEIKASTKCIVVFDYDNDGDKDLFVGGRNKPGAYPLKEQSFLLNNENGFFTDKMTSTFQTDLPGMVTDASALDIDSDGDLDLIVVGEWDHPKIFLNENGNFVYKNIPQFENFKGWWQSIKASDLDKDGDLDFVIGNIGENNKFHPTVEKPLNVLASDFDQSGTLDIVLTKTYNDKIVPVRGKECSSEQMPFLKEKFPTYKGFATSSVDEILGEENISKAEKFSVNNFSSIVLINKGNFNFEVKNLPGPAQWSPILDIIVEDYNNDGIKDLVIAGNIFETEVETPAYDSGKGLYLVGNGDGTFKADPKLTYTGMFINKDVKAIKPIILGSKQRGVLVANNSGFMELYLKLEK
jgi:hypothetical protein